MPFGLSGSDQLRAIDESFTSPIDTLIGFPGTANQGRKFISCETFRPNQVESGPKSRDSLSSGERRLVWPMHTHNGGSLVKLTVLGFLAFAEHNRTQQHALAHEK